MKPQKPHNNIGKRIYKQITKLSNDHINLNLGPEAKSTQRQHLMLLVLADLDKRSADAIAKDKHRLPPQIQYSVLSEN